jgi:hypothetical protein
MSDWHDQILREFIPIVARLTLVADPDGLLLEEGVLAGVRERALISEFEEYRTSKQKRLKVFRFEAVRAGFKKAWQEKSESGYRTIIEVAKKYLRRFSRKTPNSSCGTIRR